MSALKELVTKFRRAVSGPEPGSDPSLKPFNWEPSPALPQPEPAARPAAVAPAPEPSAAPAAAPAPSRWKRSPAEASAVVGAGIPADVADFATVYKGAGVQAPPHGYGVDRVAAMLAHKSLAGLDRSVKASAVLAALDAARVPLHDVVDDAVLRAKALAAFEAAKDLDLYGLRPRADHRIEELRGEVEAFRRHKNGEIEALTRETTAAAAGLSRLKARVRAEQERYYRAVALFVESLPARVIPMPTPEPKPAEPKPELKLLTPASATPATPTAAPEPAKTPPAKAEAPKAEPARLDAKGVAAKTPSPDATVMLAPAAQPPKPAEAGEPAKPEPQTSDADKGKA